MRLMQRARLSSEMAAGPQMASAKACLLTTLGRRRINRANTARSFGGKESLTKPTGKPLIVERQQISLGTRIDNGFGRSGGHQDLIKMMAAAAPLSDAVLGAGKGLRAVVAGYPWCGTRFHSARLAKETDLLMMSGDKDDWVSFLQCQDATHAMQVVGGQNVLMKLFPGARHAFDREGVPPTPIAAAITSTVFPTVYMDDKGLYYNMRTDEVDPTLKASDFLNYSIKGGFLHKGVTVGTEGTQASEYSREMTEFFMAKLR